MMHMHHESIAPSGPCVCTALRKAARAVSRVYDDAIAAAGITTNQFSILRNLDRHGPQLLSRLAERLVMDRTSLYRTLRPLERAGWIAIADAPGRTRQASLTPAGRAKLAEASDLWEDVQGRMVAAIGGANWAMLSDGLDGIVQLSIAARAVDVEAVA